MIARTSHVPATKPKSNRSLNHKGDCIAHCNDVHGCNDDTPSGSSPHNSSVTARITPQVVPFRDDEKGDQRQHV